MVSIQGASEISTHSRLKAAGSSMLTYHTIVGFQHTAA